MSPVSVGVYRARLRLGDPPCAPAAPCASTARVHPAFTAVSAALFAALLIVYAVVSFSDPGYVTPQPLAEPEPSGTPPTTLCRK